ncbi:LysR substrate-binding domain-containing protein [Pseudomonas plecoglossicida]|uniref:LysR substrate-binding domain-containing protein n=1 Tax=Pseudomonas plecoglossicida TaxID=70775 RepID=UPI0039773C60
MLTQLPPLNAVRAFAAAARHQSFSRAAEELHVSHRAISRHIKLLEGRLGVALFERRTRQSVLTPAGQAFYEQVSQALAQIVNAANSLTQKGSPAKVTINVRPSFAVRWLIPRLPGFMQQHPGIHPEVLTSTLAPNAAREAFDVIIRRGNSDWSATVQPHPLMEDHLRLVAAPALLQALPITTPADLLAHTLLAGKTRPDDWLQWNRLAGLRKPGRQAVLTFDHMHLVLQAAVDGLGVALCPASLLGTDLASGRLTCPLPALRVPLTRYYFGLRHDATEQTRTFINWLFQQCEEDALPPAS